MTRDKTTFYSTNLDAPDVNFETALLTGLAPDKGLYMPKAIPRLTKEDIDSMKHLEYAQIASLVAKTILRCEIDEKTLENITQDAYNFDIPIEKITANDYIMRLDQGPTASFKDFAARMMARIIQHFTKKQNKKITILTATSGDTGSAVAHAFYNLKNIKVIILYPKDEVSQRQRKQMTTLGKNITSLAVDGKFDDCQAMVKQAFSDPELKNINLTSANSINIGRLIPQTIYYFYAYSRIADSEEIVFSVPSGNFGNLMGGLLAKKMGLPVRKFIAAVNENDEFPGFLETGNYKKIAPSRNCLSNAMNVGHPSNLSRLVALYGGRMDETGKIHRMPDMEAIRKDIYTISVTDKETKDTIKSTYEKHKILIEPHGAVGWYALEKYRQETNDNTPAVCLETAHPAKFPDEIISLTGIKPELPESLKSLDEKEEQKENISADYKELKNFLKKIPL